MLHQGAAFLPVVIVIRGSHDEVRTLAQRIDHRFPGDDPVSLGGDGLREDDAVARGSVASDDGGNRAQIHRIPGIETIQRCPAQERGIDINMTNNAIRHGHPPLCVKITRFT